MIYSWIIERQELYVMLLFVAAALIAYFSSGKKHEAVRTYMYGGELMAGENESEPSIDLEVGDDGRTLWLTRCGLWGVDMENGAYSVVVDVSGTDVTIKERVTPGRPGEGGEAGAARVIIDCLATGVRYHFVYESEALGRKSAFGFTLRPGARVRRQIN